VLTKEVSYAKSITHQQSMMKIDKHIDLLFFNVHKRSLKIIQLAVSNIEIILNVFKHFLNLDKFNII